MHTLIAPLVNLTALVFILFFLVKKPVREAVLGRHAKIRDDVKAVRDQLQQSKLKYEEFSAKLKAVEVEVSAIQAGAKQDAESTKNKILVSAKQLSASILGEARSRADSMVVEFKQQVLEQMGARVVSKSEDLLKERLTGDDRVRIRKEFSGQVGSSL